MTTSVVRRRSNPATILHRARGLFAGLAVLTLGACDFPTELPIFTPRLVIEAEKTTLSVSQLLPSSVTVVGSSFSLSLAPVTVSRTLADVCSICPNATAPKPAFTSTISTSTALPADVRSVALTGGNIVLNLSNGFSFDPIRPNGTTAPFGTIVITIRSSTGTVLGTRTLDGATTSFPANSSQTVTVPLTAGTLTGPLAAEVVITSPAQTPPATTPLSTSNTFTVQAQAQGFTVSTATVGVTNKAINVTQVTLKLDGIDETLEERVKEGALVLLITNPFGVTGTLTANFSGPGVSVPAKQIVLAAGSSTVRIPFTGPELRSLLGSNVTLSITGPVSGGAAGVTVTPTQVLEIASRLDVTFTTKTN